MIICGDHAERLSVALADYCQQRIEEAIRLRGAAHIVLAGGQSPVPFYREFGARTLPWRQISLYFGDERCVAMNHTDSNYRTVTEALFQRGSARDARVFPMPALDREVGAKRYQALLPSDFDITLLGLGDDGHTASLFPGSKALAAQQSVLYIDDSPKPPKERLTLSFVALNRSQHAAFFVTGRRKADAVARVVDRRDPSLPATHIEPQGEVSFFLDADAASELKGIN